MPEAVCVKCRVFLKTAFIAAGDWCAEHDTPESQCEICHPGETASGGARSAGAELRWQQEPSMACSTSSTVITLASPEVVRAAGFEFSRVEHDPNAGLEFSGRATGGDGDAAGAGDGVGTACTHARGRHGAAEHV